MSHLQDNWINSIQSESPWIPRQWGTVQTAAEMGHCRVRSGWKCECLLWFGEFKMHHHYLMIPNILILKGSCLAFKSSMGDILFACSRFRVTHTLRCRRVSCRFLSCASRCARARLNAKKCARASNSPNPSNPNRQVAAISADQFPLNLDELLMPTFCFLLMGKSFEMDFFFS